MLKIYHHPASQNCRKVLATAEQLAVKYEPIVVHMDKGEHKSPEYLSKNPAGAVPFLDTGSLRLRESNAIIVYLNDHAGGDLIPEGDGRHETLQWLFWQSCHFGPSCDTYVWERVFKPAMLNQQCDEAVAEAVTPKFHRHAKILDDQLADNRYLLGEKLSVADFAIASSLGYAEPARIPIAEYSHIKRWRSQLQELPAWASTEFKFG